MNIVVIIPTYNEKENIKKLIAMLEDEIFPKISNHSMSILVADDHSPDGTGKIVEKMVEQWKNLHLLEGKKEGLGAAYARAMRYAMDSLQADAVVELDADFQHDPRDIPRMVKAMDDGADYAIGSRYVKGGEIPPQWELHRKIMSFFGSLFARIVLFHPELHDLTSGYKLTKTKYLKKIDLDNLFSKYYAYKIHMLHDVVKAGAKVKEVPIIFHERKQGSSKISQKDLFDSFWVVIRLRVRDSKRVFKFLMVGGTGFLIQLITQEGSIASGMTHMLASHVHPEHIKNLSDSIGAGIGAEFAILWNYGVHNFWTFTDTREIEGNSGFFVRLVKFNFASLGSITIQFLSVFIAEKLFGITVGVFGIHLPIRILILLPTIIIIVIPLNYMIYNRFIWKTHRLTAHEKTKK